jgi:hypothetical protein
MKQKNKGTGPMGPENKNDFAGKDQQQLTLPTNTGWPVIELSSFQRSLPSLTSEWNSVSEALFFFKNTG